MSRGSRRATGSLRKSTPSEITLFQKLVPHFLCQIRHCHSLMTRDAVNSAFQSYPLATDSLVSPIPDSMSFEQAVVLPLAISTACAGLYPKDLLNLPPPSATKPEQNDKTILVWGGASSVGATAIQLAAASGVSVITTASLTNHKFVKSLGAGVVFDYKSPTVVADIAIALSKTNFVGVYDAISEDSSFDAVSAILDRLNKKVPVASVHPSNKSTELFSPVSGEYLSRHNICVRKSH